MQFSERWLRTLVNPPISTEELSHLLTMSGLEVEEWKPVAPAFSGIVVAKVLEKEKHPNADRLSLCKVDAGTGTPLSIVCGAPNVAAGMKVPCAMIGAQLPGEGGKPFEIKAAKMRGVDSQGMLCSARELGLSDDHAGLLALSEDATIGANVRDVLALDDHIFIIKLTPNRADALSVLGVAREVAALTGAALTPPDVKPVAPKSDAQHPFGIDAPAGCGRFTGRVIRNVNAAAFTPDWMKERLERAGQRPISALVDVTNYVMLELGRPLHVYDLDKLRGKVGVRFGKAGEKLKLLNEQTVDLADDVLCITDESGPIGLAGIMGGDSTKADTTTRNIFLESAFFFPDAIAGRARRFNFSSDASHRFERGVDPENSIAGIERATQLILDICGGEPGPTRDVVARLPERAPVRMRVARAQKLIGVPIPATEMAGIFQRLGLSFSQAGQGADETLTVTPPSYRFDIAIEEDLVEEVARVYGFERIPTTPPVAPAVMHARVERRRSLHDLRDRLAGQGYREVINFSFVEEAWEADFAGRRAGEGNDGPPPIRLLNPIAAQYSVMRSTLFGGLLANVRYNLNRKQERVRVFEVGRVYRRDPSIKGDEANVAGLAQPIMVGGIAYGLDTEPQWGIPARAVDFFDVKGDVEALVAPLTATLQRAAHPALHPGRSARILLAGRQGNDGRAVGWIGELHPRWQQKYELPQAPILFEVEAEALLEMGLPAYREVSKFPPIVRDLALVVAEDVPVAGLLKAFERVSPPSVTDIELFDVYRGKGLEQKEKSLAFRVVMQDTAKTLTDSEADAVIAALVAAASGDFGGKLRS